MWGRRKWGLGSTPDNIFDPAIIDQVPPEIRHTLDAAIAEEATATALAELGPPFVVWHDVLVEGDRSSTVSKIDHVLLGPSLLWAIASENWGSAVRIVRRAQHNHSRGGCRTSLQASLALFASLHRTRTRPQAGIESLRCRATLKAASK